MDFLFLYATHSKFRYVQSFHHLIFCCFYFRKQIQLLFSTLRNTIRNILFLQLQNQSDLSFPTKSYLLSSLHILIFSSKMAVSTLANFYPCPLFLFIVIIICLFAFFIAKKAQGKSPYLMKLLGMLNQIEIFGKVVHVDYRCHCCFLFLFQIGE